MTIHDSFIEVTRERDEALRRLAEVEQALRELVDACKTNPNADMWQELVVRVAAAVLDKGEPEVEQALRPKVTINIESRRDDDGGFAAGYSSGLRDGRRGR